MTESFLIGALSVVVGVFGVLLKIMYHRITRLEECMVTKDIMELLLDRLDKIEEKLDRLMRQGK